MKFVAACLVAVFVTLVSADNAPGYGRIRGPRPKFIVGQEPLDLVDKLYKRLTTAQSEIKTASEILGNLEARQSLEKKALDRLSISTFPDLVTDNIVQNKAIQDVEDQVIALEDALGILEGAALALSQLNKDNTDAQEVAENMWAQRRLIDVTQGNQINNLAHSVRDFKAKLLSVMENEFQVVYNAIEESSNVLDTLKEQELARMCEVGQVTLDYDDRKAEYLFQTEFDSVPQVLYSVCGYKFDLEARQGNSYDNYYREPNAIGLQVTADASKTGVTLEVFDKSFGDTSLLTADVCFQACSISPGDALASSARSYLA